MNTTIGGGPSESSHRDLTYSFDLAKKLGYLHGAKAPFALQVEPDAIYLSKDDATNYVRIARTDGSYDASHTKFYQSSSKGKCTKVPYEPIPQNLF